MKNLPLGLVTVWLLTAVTSSTASDFLDDSMLRLLRSERSDCRSVPRKFRKAQHPYAKAPDGCSGFQSPREVRDTWGPVNFGPACDSHDRCYYTIGEGWSRCNNNFRKDLTRACERDLRTKIPGIKIAGRRITPDRYLPADPARMAICMGLVATYYAGVQAGVAAGIFDDTQRLQRQYERWYKDCH